MQDCTQSRVRKCRGEIKTAVIGKNISENIFCLIDFLPIMWYTNISNFGGQNDEIFIRKRGSGALEHLRAQRPQLLRGRSRSRRSSSKQKVKRQPKQVAFWRRRRDLNSRAGFPTYALSRGASSANLSTSPNYSRSYQNIY